MNNKLIGNILFGMAILCVGFTFCTPAPAEEIQKPYEIDNVLVTFFWFDTERELQDYRAWAEDEEVDRDMAAYSASEPYPTKNVCHLDAYVVRPLEVDDDMTLSIGHEVLHCVHGPEYHEE